MRGVFGAMAIAMVISFAGSAGAAVAPQAAAPVNATPITNKNIVVAQRCRCVERRWNGSCKLRVCRDHW